MSAPDAVILALDARRAELEEEERRRAENPIGAELGRVTHQILDTRSEGPAGIAVKLNMAFDAMSPDPRMANFDDLDWAPKLLMKALLDAEYLAKAAT